MNLAEKNLNETAKKTGMQSETPPKKDASKISTPERTSSITARSSKLPPTTCSQSPKKGKCPCFGVQRELVSLGELGLKLEWTPTPKIQGPNSGAGTRARRMSSLMSSEEVSILPTCSAGSTATQSRLKRKVRPRYLGPLESGSLVT